MPSPCQLTSGITLACRDNTAGVRRFWIFSGGTGITAGPAGVDYTSGLISVSTLNFGGGTFYLFDCFPNTTSYEEITTDVPENGVVAIEQNLRAILYKLSVSQRNLIRTLSGAQNLKILIETNNYFAATAPRSRWLLMGLENGASLITAVGTTGTTFEDANKYDLFFQAKETEAAMFLIPTGNSYVALNNMISNANGNIELPSSANFGPV